MVHSEFEIDDISLYRRICGFQDRNLKIIERVLDIAIIPRGNMLIINAAKEKNELAMKLLHLMGDYLHVKDDKYEFDEFDIKYLAKTLASGREMTAKDIDNLKISIPDNGKTILPRTLNQASYIATIHKRPITISYGPAGTGKTYLAIAVAISYLLGGRVERIILTRPAVEAGESLGFLPGDMIQKVNPYLRPLYDAMFDMLPFERVKGYMERGNIEVAPLAFMRGRTLSKSFIILDEAQNTTIPQMKMFLTRLGNNSKIVISGDITQIDLEKPKKSGLLHAMRILREVEEIGIVEFVKDDICRHPIVEKIVAAYERHSVKE